MKQAIANNSIEGLIVWRGEYGHINTKWIAPPSGDPFAMVVEAKRSASRFSGPEDQVYVQDLAYSLDACPADSLSDYIIGCLAHDDDLVNSSEDTFVLYASTNEEGKAFDAGFVRIHGSADPVILWPGESGSV